MHCYCQNCDDLGNDHSISLMIDLELVSRDKTNEKVKHDRPTNQPTDQRTKRGVELRSTPLKAC